MPTTALLVTDQCQPWSGPWVAISEANTFNNRLQPTQLRATSPVPLTLRDLSYGYDQGTGKNNGNVVQIANNRDGTRSVAYTYDELNRIKTARTYNSTRVGRLIRLRCLGQPGEHYCHPGVGRKFAGGGECKEPGGGV